MRLQRRLVDDHVSRPLQVVDQPLRGDSRHRLVRVVRLLPVVDPECEREGPREFVAHGETMPDRSARGPQASAMARMTLRLVPKPAEPEPIGVV
jgi:hypothetical protein